MLGLSQSPGWSLSEALNGRRSSNAGGGGGGGGGHRLATGNGHRAPLKKIQEAPV